MASPLQQQAPELQKKFRDAENDQERFALLHKCLCEKLADAVEAHTGTRPNLRDPEFGIIPYSQLSPDQAASRLDEAIVAAFDQIAGLA